MKSGNSTLAAGPDDHLRLHPKFHHIRGRYPRWLSAHGGALFSGEGDSAIPLSFTGTLQDITDEVRADQMLRDERARLELALSAGELAVWELNLKTNVVSPSPKLNALYRFPAEARPTLAEFQACYVRGERERVEADWRAQLARGDNSLRFEAKYAWPDGVMKWIAVRAQVGMDSKGAPERMIGVAMDVTERRLSEERLLITANELQHRVKNTLAVVQSLAVQTFRAGAANADSVQSFMGRLNALATATEIMTRHNWDKALVGDVLSEVLRPHRDGDRDPFELVGGAVRIGSTVAVNLGMAIHELATNALKYGALSREGGRVRVSWGVSDGQLQLEWRERGGPIVHPPATSGFGTRLLQRGLLQPPTGSIELAFLPEGVCCHISAAVEGLA